MGQGLEKVLERVRTVSRAGGDPQEVQDLRQEAVPEVRVELALPDPGDVPDLLDELGLGPGALERVKVDALTAEPQRALVEVVDEVVGDGVPQDLGAPAAHGEVAGREQVPDTGTEQVHDLGLHPLGDVDLVLQQLLERVGVGAVRQRGVEGERRSDP